MHAKKKHAFFFFLAQTEEQYTHQMNGTDWPFCRMTPFLPASQMLMRIDKRDGNGFDNCHIAVPGILSVIGGYRVGG